VGVLLLNLTVEGEIDSESASSGKIKLLKKCDREKNGHLKITPSKSPPLKVLEM
jgi:hypothetical protein